VETLETQCSQLLAHQQWEVQVPAGTMTNEGIVRWLYRRK
jgi:hypothetical protein